MWLSGYKTLGLFENGIASRPKYEFQLSWMKETHIVDTSSKLMWTQTHQDKLILNLIFFSFSNETFVITF